MIDKILKYSLEHKLIILLFCLGIVGFGTYSLYKLPIGAVPDITNNQVQIITTSKSLATEDIEKFITYPIELEMANLPGVSEIRSVSKFGLSVVTVVFDDAIGTYLPRQLIAEKLKNAEDKIPKGFGTPFMGPITTGLGEIYQYVLDTDSSFKDKYSLSDLRTIQDWIVKRQFAGIPGVVEVNTWGGHLKQYEVAIDPNRLKSLNLSITEVYQALEKNNKIVGGGYIEKSSQSFFVRGQGLVLNLNDIENIVVKNTNSIPILIKDLGKVQFGYATRFGAITANGQGEKVLGQIMMLKGADSKSVMAAVQKKALEIQKTLPEGVSINPILERTELIDKTTNTILENLILGFLIVIFVVVLLLGNFRSGLVIASVIPLCLFFALSLMYIFNIDANLMSLGAIDFGIIIDGAVIIVEYVAFKITSNYSLLSDKSDVNHQKTKDEITLKSTSKMMHSAIFGQLIIIIVFIPILSLVGIEGKMFKPMALVFCFALIGAMLFCVTYLPVVSSLVLKANVNAHNTWSFKIIEKIKSKYSLLLEWVLLHRKKVLIAAVVLMIASFTVFSRMGGEFVPTLDEGDFVIQPILKTGTSLSETIKVTTKIEKILVKFPEVDQVVSRIGAAEVPTDPMSMEESDVIIKLKPKSEWKTAKSKDELADTFKRALSNLSGIDYEFTQPIEMRFNELITGVRSDLAIKIYGGNLEILNSKAKELAQLIKGVEGAADISIEKIAGLPQMIVKYEPLKLAQYGLNIEELNEVIAIGFAGKSTGVVFENEKQFELVVRFDSANRRDLMDISNSSVKLDNGSLIPLSEVAQIYYAAGPAKISRDNTKRRIVIGVNVRNKDLATVVADIQNIVNTKMILPSGYTVEYGGQFKNLETAKARLMVAVPIALILIFLMLYFAFGTLKYALIIYSAIPMAAIGGILLLQWRGYPFSISAGIGFIALFGIAVLNGIVLIEEFRELELQGISSIKERIIKGTKNRLRPVLLTAMAAALGFLPMALTTSTGAEVQRPLATVVVGGLFTSTILTLFLLPVLYFIFEQKRKLPKISPKKKEIALIGLLLVPFLAFGQTKKISPDQAVEMAINQNLGLRASHQRAEMQQLLQKTAYELDKTELFYGFDQNNIAPNQLPLNVFGMNQNLDFPTKYAARGKYLKSKANLWNFQYQLDKQKLTKEVYKRYYQTVYLEQMLLEFAIIDSLYQTYFKLTNRKYEAGESNLLEKLLAETKAKEIGLKLNTLKEQRKQSLILLNLLIQSPEPFTVFSDTLVQIKKMPFDTLSHFGLNFSQQNVNLTENQYSLEKQELLPDLKMAIFRGQNARMDANAAMWGIQMGLVVPLFFNSQQIRIKSSRLNVDMAKNENTQRRSQIFANYQVLESEISQLETALLQFKNSDKKLSEQLVLHAHKAFQNGEIDFMQFTQLLENATNIKINFLQVQLDLNMTILEANYLND